MENDYGAIANTIITAIANIKNYILLYGNIENVYVCGEVDKEYVNNYYTSATQYIVHIIAKFKSKKYISKETTIYVNEVEGTVIYYNANRVGNVILKDDIKKIIGEIAIKDKNIKDDGRKTKIKTLISREIYKIRRGYKVVKDDCMYKLGEYAIREINKYVDTKDVRVGRHTQHYYYIKNHINEFSNCIGELKNIISTIHKDNKDKYEIDNTYNKIRNSLRGD